MRQRHIGHPVPIKPVRWWGTSLSNVRAFPAEVRRDIGHQLQRLQEGRLPSDWKPFGAVGPGVIEIRIHDVVEYRLFAVAKFREAVHVLHAFEKRTRQTPLRHVNLARNRYATMMEERGKG